VVVDIDDGALQAGQVSRADGLVDSYFIAHAQDGEGGGGADRVQQPPARMDSLRERGEVIVEVTVSDRVEQRALMAISSVARCRRERLAMSREDGSATGPIRRPAAGYA
jgi:hypothetical protein